MQIREEGGGGPASDRSQVIEAVKKPLDAGNLIEAKTNLIKAAMNLIEAKTNPIEAAMNLIEAKRNLIEAKLRTAAWKFQAVKGRSICWATPRVLSPGSTTGSVPDESNLEAFRRVTDTLDKGRGYDDEDLAPAAVTRSKGTIIRGQFDADAVMMPAQWAAVGLDCEE